MQRHESIGLHNNSEENEPNSLITALKEPDDDKEFYTASVDFLNKRLEEKCRQYALRQKTTKSCCDLSIGDIAPELRKTQSKVKFGFDVPIESDYSLDMNKVLPFPKPKSTKDSFLTRLTNTFRKYRRCFNAVVDYEPDDSETLKNYSSFKFPRCERLNKHNDSSRLWNITEELSRTSVKDISDPRQSNSKGDFCTSVK